MKRTIGNLAAAKLDQLATAVKRSLKKTQYRPPPHRRLSHGRRPEPDQLTQSGRHHTFKFSSGQ